MINRNQKGFTLIEVVVVAGIIAILAGVLVPLIFGQIDESRLSRAKGDIKAIQTAITRFKNDCTFWPNRKNGTDPATNVIETLFSAGNAISGLGWVDGNGEGRPMKMFLETNDNNYTNWKGPYLSGAGADPWGNTYLVGAINFEDTTNGMPVWIISAGPDGIIQTNINSPVCFDGVSIDPITSVASVGDDICLRLK